MGKATQNEEVALSYVLFLCAKSPLSAAGRTCAGHRGASPRLAVCIELAIQQYSCRAIVDLRSCRLVFALHIELWFHPIESVTRREGEVWNPQEWRKI